MELKQNVKIVRWQENLRKLDLSRWFHIQIERCSRRETENEGEGIILPRVKFLELNISFQNKYS